jgi:hypothetical protein
LSVLEAGPGGGVVGTAGVGLRRLRVGGPTVVAGLASDFAVDPEHRSLGPAMMLQRAVLETLDDGVDVIYGLPNAKALPVFKRLGYSADAALTRYVKVLAVERYLTGVPGPRVGRKIIAGVVDPVLRVGSPETWRPRRGRTLVELATFDERFDELWARTADAFGVACERTASFLRWRYDACPLLSYTTLGLIERGGERLAAYAVCTLGSDQQVTVIDFWYGSDASVRDDLLAAVLSWSRAAGAASVACEVAGAGQVAEGLVRFGFRHRGAGSAIVISPTRDGTPAPQLSAWPFLRADEDYN